MSATPHEGESRCLLCDGVLAADHQGYLCTPCLSSRLGYDPATDPGFDAALERLFLANSAAVVHPRRALGVGCHFRTSVKSAIRRLRRSRLVIVGVPVGGYVCLGTKAAPPDRRRRSHA